MVAIKELVTSPFSHYIQLRSLVKPIDRISDLCEGFKENVFFGFQFALYRRLPLKAVSRAWGYFNGLRLPVWLRTPAFSLYIWLFDCQLHEAAVTDLTSYKNLSEFFRRQLRAGVRPVDHSHVLVSLFPFFPFLVC